MNRIICFVVLLTSCISVTFCSKNNKNNKNIEEGDEDVFFYGAIPGKFTCFQKEYSLENRTDTLSIGKEIGWLINEEDLNKWKTIDDNDEFVYAIDMFNGVIRNDADPNLKNRYELYKHPDDSNGWVVKDNGGWFLIYKIGENK